ELLVFLVRKELSVKYKNSVLGFVWSMLNPALTLAVYYFVFQEVLKAGIPGFAIFLMSGLIVWNLFSSAVPGATAAIVANAGIVKKVAFPREILALASIGASLVFFGFQAVVLVLAMVAFGFRPAVEYLPLLVPAMVALLLFSAALAVFFSAVNVRFRDVQHLLEVAFMAWFWATPIVYSYQTVARQLRARHVLWLYFANPVTTIVLTFQRAIYAKVTVFTKGPVLTRGGSVSAGGNLPILPTWGQLTYLRGLAVVIAVSAVLFVGALAVFGRLEGSFAEDL
ncbi:MAG TPA: ABC transporter permease, partial [Acidimicrobiales bacterium]|nr:ABC transporter permease [Acidimicrobiales bacterium]